MCARLNSIPIFQIPVNTMHGKIARTVIPTASLFYSIPLRFRSGKLNACKRTAIFECVKADRGYAVRYCYTFK